MHHRPQGFSLLEMMAALLILAVALTALLALAGRSVRLQRQAARQAELALAARSLLALSGSGLPRPGTGRLDDGCRWQLQTRPVMAEGTLRLYRLDLVLSCGGMPRPQRFHLLRLVREPPPEPAS